MIRYDYEYGIFFVVIHNQSTTTMVVVGNTINSEKKIVNLSFVIFVCLFDSHHSIQYLYHHCHI